MVESRFKNPQLYKRLKKFKLEIGKHNKITINDESLVSEKYLNLAIKLYGDALNKLDQDIQNQFDTCAQLKYSSFYWCLTYDIYRDDGIKDTVLHYLVVHLAKHFLLRGLVEIVFNYYPGLGVLKQLKGLKNIHVILKVRLLSKIRSWIRNSFGPLVVLVKYSAVVLRKDNKESQIFRNTAKKHVFLVNLDTPQTRWKGYPNSLNLKNGKGYFLGVDLQRCKPIAGDKQFKIKLFSFSNFRKAFIDVLGVFKEKRQLSSTSNSIFKDNLSRQSFLQTLTVLWRFYAWKELFEKHGVTDIHVMTTFGDPFKRLPLAVAKKMGATGHIFACRPYLSEYRSEDRVILADKSEDSICQIPRDVVVLDDYSQNQLSKAGVSSTVYKQVDTTVTYVAEYGLLLLFSDFVYNENLIKLMDKLKLRTLKLFIREHPLVKLNTEQRKKLHALSSSVVDLNRYEWSELKFNNVLSFSANTTAGIDAVRRGCDLIWLPFLSYNFLQFAGYANDIGKVVYSEDEWVVSVNEYLNYDSQ